MPIQIQDYGATPETKRLGISWTVRSDTDVTKLQAALIQVAYNSAFTESMRLFLVPWNLPRIDLDLGRGSWFFRVGTLLGSKQSGSIQWTDVYGPISTRSEKPCIAEPLAETTPDLIAIGTIGTSELHGGAARIVPEGAACGYLFVELSLHADFPHTKTAWSYGLIDKDRPYIDLHGLMYVPDKSYTARLYGTSAHADGLSAWMVRALVHLKDVTDIKPAMQMRGGDGSSYTEQVANAALAADRSMKFVSHTDYVRFMNARRKF